MNSRIEELERRFQELEIRNQRRLEESFARIEEMFIAVWQQQQTESSSQAKRLPVVLTDDSNGIPKSGNFIDTKQTPDQHNLVEDRIEETVLGKEESSNQNSKKQGATTSSLGSKKSEVETEYCKVQIWSKQNVGLALKMRGITVRWRRSRGTKDSRIASKKTTHPKGMRNFSEEMASSESMRVSTGLGPSLVQSEPKQLVVIERIKAEPSPPEPLGALPVTSACVRKIVRRKESEEVGNAPPPPPEPPDQNVTGERNREVDKKRRWKVRVSWATPSTSRPPDATTTTGEWPRRRPLLLVQERARNDRCEDERNGARTPLRSPYELGLFPILMGQAQITLGKVKMRSSDFATSDPTRIHLKLDDAKAQGGRAPSPSLMRVFPGANLLWLSPPSEPPDRSAAIDGEGCVKMSMEGREKGLVVVDRSNSPTTVAAVMATQNLQGLRLSPLGKEETLKVHDWVRLEIVVGNGRDSLILCAWDRSDWCLSVMDHVTHTMGQAQIVISEGAHCSNNWGVSQEKGGAVTILSLILFEQDSHCNLFQLLFQGASKQIRLLMEIYKSYSICISIMVEPPLVYKWDPSGTARDEDTREGATSALECHGKSKPQHQQVILTYQQEGRWLKAVSEIEGKSPHLCANSRTCTVICTWWPFPHSTEHCSHVLKLMDLNFLGGHWKIAMRYHLSTQLKVSGINICTLSVTVDLKHQIHIDYGNWGQARSELQGQLDLPRIVLVQSSINCLGEALTCWAGINVELVQMEKGNEKQGLLFVMTRYLHQQPILSYKSHNKMLQGEICLRMQIILHGKNTSIINFIMGLCKFWKQLVGLVMKFSGSSLVTLVGLTLDIESFKSGRLCRDGLPCAGILILLFQYILQKINSSGIAQITISIPIGMPWCLAENSSAANVAVPLPDPSNEFASSSTCGSIIEVRGSPSWEAANNNLPLKGSMCGAMWLVCEGCWKGSSSISCLLNFVYDGGEIWPSHNWVQLQSNLNARACEVILLESTTTTIIVLSTTIFSFEFVVYCCNFPLLSHLEDKVNVRGGVLIGLLIVVSYSS